MSFCKVCISETFLINFEIFSGAMLFFDIMHEVRNRFNLEKTYRQGVCFD